jgi:hypothetical protein
MTLFERFLPRISSSPARAGVLLVLSLGLVAVGGPACNEGREGDRCNPLLSHDECGGGALVCSGPGTAYPLPGGCVENYCCPKNAASSSNPECNGTDPYCAVDAGAGTGADAGAEDAGGG